MPDEKRWELIILGRGIGTCTGWVDIGLSQFQFLEFEPFQGIPIPPGTICVDFDAGTVVHYSNGEAAGTTLDAVTLLRDIPRKVPL